MKILIIGPSWIGDTIMSHSLYRTLKSKYLNSTIDVITPKWCHAVLKFMPEVDNIIIVPLKHGSLSLTKRYVIGKKLSKINYDCAYILPNSFKSALIPFFAGIKKRIGWRGEMRYGLINDLRILNKNKLPLMVERYVSLANEKFLKYKNQNKKSFFFPKIIVNYQKKIEIKKKFYILNNRLIVGFCYGAESSFLKCWPHYHYASLAKLLINDGYQVILFGSKNDKVQGEKILQLLDKKETKYCKNLGGKTSLIQAVKLIANCHIIVSNDSGLMHISAALNLPLIALYGPTNPSFTPPLSKKAQIIKKKSKYKKINLCKSEQNYHKDLIDINPIDVFKKLKIILNQHI